MRQRQLFAVACCYRVWDQIKDQRLRDAIEAAERLADGEIDEAEYETYFQPIEDIHAHTRTEDFETNLRRSIYFSLRPLRSAEESNWFTKGIAESLASFLVAEENQERLAIQRAEEIAQCQIIRDLFGSPFQPFRFDAAWLNVQGRGAGELAETIYRDRRFDLLPSLGDVLEKSGCHDERVLAHCRSDGPHVRGCWVIDALLQKEPGSRLGLLTENDWQACCDTVPLLHFLQDKGSDRKWRLLSVACCRRIDHLITDERSRKAVDVATRFAEGQATDEELRVARIDANQAYDEADREHYGEEFCAGSFSSELAID